MAKGDKQEVASAKKAVNKRKNDFAKIAKTPKQGLKAATSEKKAMNKFVKDAAKRGVNVGGSGSVSARKPSMPVKQNAKNKMKAQGAKIMGSPTSGYGKSTKPKK